jgi:hypothetical protein
MRRTLWLDLLAASAVAPLVAHLLDAEIHATVLGIRVRANDPWRWLAFAAVVMLLRAAFAGGPTQQSFAARLLETVSRTLTFVPFAAIGAAIVAGLVTSCGGLDSAGYLGAADLLARGSLTEAARLAPILPFLPSTAFAPLGWVAAAQPAHIAPEFPLGLPMLMAVAARVGGPMAPFWVSPVLAAASIVVVGLAARSLWDSSTALLAASLVAASPVFVNMAIQPMSDIAATFWMTSAAAAACAGRPRPLLWGFAGGMAVLTRPPLLIAVLIVVAFAGWSSKHLIAGASVLLCFLLLLGAAQWRMFGNPLMSGHGSARELFTRAALAHNLSAHAKWWVVAHTPLAVLAFAAGWRRSPAPAVRSLLTFAAVALPYLLYAVRFDDWEMGRFLLPGTVWILMTGAAGVLWTARSLHAPVTVVRLVVALAACSSSLVFLRSHHVFDVRVQESKYPIVAAWVGNNTPASAAVIASLHSGSLKHYTGREVLRMDAMPSLSLLDSVRALDRAGISTYAVLESGTETSVFFERFRVDVASLTVTPITAVRGAVIMRLSP